MHLQCHVEKHHFKTKQPGKLKDETQGCIFQSFSLI